MAEAAKKSRSAKLSTFTRKANILKSNLDQDAPTEACQEAYDNVVKAYEDLEKAHDAYVLIADEQAITDEGDYLLIPTQQFTERQVRFSKLKVANDKNAKDDEDRRKVKALDDAKKETMRTEFEAAKAAFEAGVDLFVNPCTKLKTLQDSNVGAEDFRKEVDRMTEERDRLKQLLEKMVGLSPAVDMSRSMDRFKKDVEDVYQTHLQGALEYLKSAPTTTRTVVTSRPGATGAGHSSLPGVKRELVSLPKFSGKEPACFLNYPVWRTNWDKLIEVYPDDVRPAVLFDHIDDQVKRRLVGLENEYDPALEKMAAYYGNKLKVVNCCLREIATVKPIRNANDYGGLVVYSQTIEQNYKRLLQIGEEKELSNATVTNEIIQRLPGQIQDKWMDFFMGKDEDARKNPLPLLIKWMEEQRKRWEYQETSRTGGKEGRSMFTNYGNDNEGREDGRDRSGLICYKCNEAGHIQRNCPSTSKGATPGKAKAEGSPKHKRYWCAYHTDPPLNHWSNSCTKLRKLPYEERIQLLKKNRDCEICCGDHNKADCRSNRTCGGEKKKFGCGDDHKVHELFCQHSKVTSVAVTVIDSTPAGDEEHAEETANAARVKKPDVILAVMKISGAKKDQTVSAFWDMGSTGHFIRDAYARKQGFKSRREILSVTTLAGDVKTCEGVVYTCTIHDLDGQRYVFEAHGLESITGVMGKLDTTVVRRIFPHLTQKELFQLQRMDNIDYLIGFEHPSWYPQREVQARGGGDLWVLRSRFGSCIGGSHPEVRELMTKSANLYTVNKVFFTSDKMRLNSLTPSIFTDMGTVSCPLMSASDKTGGTVHPPVPARAGPVSHHRNGTDGSAGAVGSADLLGGVLLPEGPGMERPEENLGMAAVSYAAKSAPLSSDSFFQLESLGCPVMPKCGGCRCGKCPVPGSQYSFREQQQLDQIRRQLHYDSEKKKWTAELPWVKPRSCLPDNYESATKALVSTEKSLSKKPGWGEVYGEQVRDMVERGAAVKLSPEDISKWKGAVHYIPHLVVQNPESKSTPVRLCFDASRPQGKGGICLNDCLAKGPDNYINNLCGVLVGFRVCREAAKGDIKKFYNSALLVEEDCHCQRFLWRDMETDRLPDVYMVVVNNIGIRPSGAIATSMLEKTADMYVVTYPDAAMDLKEMSYVDDVGVGDNDLTKLKVKTSQIDEILAAGGMKCKKWIYSHESGEEVEFGGEMEDGDLKGFTEKVLGLVWSPLEDKFIYFCKLNFGPKKGKLRLEPNLTKDEFLENPPSALTRRQVLRQVASIFDPLSLLTPVVLQAKLLLRDSWNNETEKLGWDDPLPECQVSEWIKFFTVLFELETISFARSLTPAEETVGDPWLIIFSDGAKVSFGACAYIRWKVASGGYWCRLIMSKGKIAPKHRSTIPRMELSGATMQVRMEKFIKENTSFNFAVTWHLVDSSTVLGYLHKDNGSFRPYEGVRVSEIQSNSIYEGGVLQNWAWISGPENPADLTTKPVRPSDIGRDSVWQNGPSFLYQDVDKWPIKTSFSKETLDGELMVMHAATKVVTSVLDQRLDQLLLGCSSLDKLLRVTARILRVVGGRDSRGQVVDMKSMKSILMLAKDIPTAGELKKTRSFWIWKCQGTMSQELENGKYRKLAPKQDADGVWRVGTRMAGHVPFTCDNTPPVLLPNRHRFTLLMMEDTHRRGHCGQDLTLSKFRQRGFWCVQGGKLAKKVRRSCVLCRKADAVLMEQPMGPIPAERLLQPMAWGQVELDLMGPFKCRGEHNPRTTVKVYGMVIEDKNSGAVHADIVVNYSASAVLAALRRFAWLRGWPSCISSDPGSQLESAGGKLEKWWDMFHENIQEFAGKRGFKWDISPANSPWRQGRVERRIGCIKRIVKIALGETRVTQSELQTCLMEAAGIANERPLTIGPPRDDGTYPIITPNTLLLGRSSIVPPDDTELGEEMPYRDRYQVITQVTEAFWSKWAVEVTPKLVDRKKWHSGSQRELKLGDLVLVADKTAVKAKYRLAIVSAVNTSTDGVIRSAELTYHLPGPGKVEQGVDGQFKWSGGRRGKLRGRAITITRSIQRLSLILGVEEQTQPVIVIEDYSHVIVTAGDGDNTAGD